MAIDWVDVAQDKLAAYLANGYVTDLSTVVALADFTLDRTGVVGDKIPELLHPPVKLDPATKDYNVTLSNNNLTITGGSDSYGYGTAAATGPGWMSGKLYLEVTVNAAGAYPARTSIGVGESDAIRHLPGNGDSHSVGYWSDGGVPPTPTFPSYTNGDKIGMAVNMDSGAGGLVRVWWRKNGTWIEDPASTDGWNVSPSTTLGTPVWPLFFVNPSQQLTVNFGATAFTYAAPTGYVAWATAVTTGILTAPQTLPGLVQAPAATHPDIAAVFQSLPAVQQAAIARMLTLQPVQALQALQQAATATVT
jgi:hypothetical protein